MKRFRKIKILKKRAIFFLVKKRLPNILSGKFLKSGDLSTYLRIQTETANELKSHHSNQNLTFFVKKKLDLLRQPIELRIWERLKRKQGKIATTTKKQLKQKATMYSILLAIPSWPYRQFVEARNLLKTQVQNRKDPKKIPKFLFTKKKDKKKVVSPQERKKRDAILGVLNPEIDVSFADRIKTSLFDLKNLEQSKIYKRQIEDMHLAVDYNITSRNKRKRWY